MEERKEEPRSEKECVFCGSEGLCNDLMEYITAEHSVVPICRNCAGSMGNKGMPKQSKLRQLNLFTGLPEPNEPDEEEVEFQSPSEEYCNVLDYRRFTLEKAGYYIGYDWAKEQHDLSQLIEFYDEFEKGRLSPRRFAQLELMIDPWGIALIGSTDEEPDIAEGESIIIADESFPVGVMYGVMEFVGEQRYPRRIVDRRKA
jgi:hypothetical protein